MGLFKRSFFGGYNKAQVEEYVITITEDLNKEKHRLGEATENLQKEQDRCTALQQRITEDAQQMEDLREENGALTRALSTMKERMEEAVEEKETAIKAMEDEMSCRQAQYEENLSKQRSRYEQEMDNLRSDYQDQLFSMGETYRTSMEELQEKYRISLEQQRMEASRLSGEEIQQAFLEQAALFNEKYQAVRTLIQEYMNALNVNESLLMQVQADLQDLERTMPESIEQVTGKEKQEKTADPYTLEWGEQNVG